MSADDRILEARVKAERLDNLCLEIEAIHANNRYLIYDEIFSGGLGNTFAGNAFSALRITSFAYEVVRIIALWDGPAKNRISIPEIMMLIDDPVVLAKLKSEFLGGYDDPNLGLLRGRGTNAGSTDIGVTRSD